MAEGLGLAAHDRQEERSERGTRQGEGGGEGREGGRGGREAGRGRARCQHQALKGYGCGVEG